MQIKSTILSIISCILISLSFSAVLGQDPEIGYQTVTTGLSSPVDVVNAGGSDLFIVQQGGIIRRWNGTVLSTYINISSVLPASPGGEQGLLSVAFHPQYASNGYFFVLYTNSSGNPTLARYRRNLLDPLIGDPATAQVLLTLVKPVSYTNHNGGKLIFGTDGMLYLGTGDSGSGGDPGNLAQNPNSLFGKMLRINVNGFATSAPFYAIPADNPFLAPGDGIANEIYNMGLRNPWRWSFDRLNGDFWIADVGQGNYEEVNHITAASAAAVNYGWRCREGMHNFDFSGCTATYTDPIFEYTHNNTTGGFSVTGGYVYRGSEFPTLYGYYVTVDYISTNLWLIKPNQPVIMQTGLLNNIAGFGESSDGSNLYAVRRSSGTLYKVIVTNAVPVILNSFTAAKQNGFNKISWKVSSEINIDHYEVEYSINNLAYSNAGNVEANGSIDYTFNHQFQNNSAVFYRLKIVEQNGTIFYSPVVMINGSITEIKVYPTIVSNNSITIELPKKGLQMQMISADGKLFFQKDFRNEEGINILSLPASTAGVYLLRFFGNETNEYRKIIVK
ncbi:MAG TPA: PQQ-dependent sugar dehydrogenase [Ferruginibacter sp.]|nr:PQQ-dependent sugar dehydrogenase [Ferruginibacter sp.]